MIKKLSFETFLQMVPVAKQRAYIGRRGNFTPIKTAYAENDIKIMLRKNKAPMFKGAVELFVVFCLKKPKTSKREFPSVRPDLDNFIKLLSDAGNGILWQDDGQIVRLNAEKIYAPTQGICLKINALESLDEIRPVI